MERVDAAADPRSAISERKAIAVRERRSPIPPGERRLGDSILHGELEMMEISAVPGKKQRRPVVAAPSVEAAVFAVSLRRSTVQRGVVLIATLVGDPGHRGDGVSERLELLRRELVDVLTVTNAGWRAVDGAVCGGHGSVLAPHPRVGDLAIAERASRSHDTAQLTQRHSAQHHSTGAILSAASSTGMPAM